MLKLCIGTPKTYSSACSRSFISESEAASALLWAAVLDASGVYAAPTQDASSTGKLRVVRSRSITLPPGWDLSQVSANFAVSFREIDPWPMGLESSFSKVDIVIASDHQMQHKQQLLHTISRQT